MRYERLLMIYLNNPNQSISKINHEGTMKNLLKLSLIFILAIFFASSRPLSAQEAKQTKPKV